MVMIRFAEISGLYSYNSEKNRIDFGKRTLIVGSNNTGKSLILYIRGLSSPRFSKLFATIFTYPFSSGSHFGIITFRAIQKRLRIMSALS